MLDCRPTLQPCLQLSESATQQKTLRHMARAEKIAHIATYLAHNGRHKDAFVVRPVSASCPVLSRHIVTHCWMIPQCYFVHAIARQVMWVLLTASVTAQSYGFSGYSNKELLCVVECLETWDLAPVIHLSSKEVDRKRVDCHKDENSDKCEQCDLVNARIARTLQQLIDV